MAGEHHALRAEGAQLAKQLGVTQQEPHDDKSVSQARTEMAKLKAMGAARVGTALHRYE